MLSLLAAVSLGFLNFPVDHSRVNIAVGALFGPDRHNQFSGTADRACIVDMTLKRLQGSDAAAAQYVMPLANLEKVVEAPPGYAECAMMKLGGRATDIPDDDVKMVMVVGLLTILKAFPESDVHKSESQAGVLSGDKRLVGLIGDARRAAAFTESKIDQPNANNAYGHAKEGGGAHVSGPKRGDALSLKVIGVMLLGASGLANLGFAFMLGLRREWEAVPAHSFAGIVAGAGGCLGCLYFMNAL